LKAVIDGVVLKVSRESEGPIQPGTPIMEIGNPDDIEIVVDLLSEDAVRVALGDPVIISGWGGDNLTGRVSLIEPFAFTKVSALGIEEQRINVIVSLDEPEKATALGHGYRVDVAVVTWQQEDVLSVPMTTLFRQGKDWMVFVNKNNRASLQNIEIGEINGRYAQVLDGVVEGDQVIEHPSGRIEHKRRIVNRLEE